MFFVTLIFVTVSFSLSPVNVGPQQKSLNASGDYYHVILDEHGGLTVLERIEFSNEGDVGVNRISFQIPYDSQEIIFVKQVIPEECPPGQTCLAIYREKAIPLTVEKMGGFTSMYLVKLNKSIGKGEHGALVVFYKVKRYSYFGIAESDFHFTTNSWPFKIEKTRVAVSVPKGFELKGAEWKGDTNYFPSTEDFENETLLVKSAPGYVWETGNRGPFFSFPASAKYSDSLLSERQYFFLGLFSGLLLSGAGILLWRFVIQKKRKSVE